MQHFNLHPPKTIRITLKTKTGQNWPDAYAFEKITLTTEMGQNWPDDKKEQIKIENEGVQEERTTVGEEKRGRKERFFE